MTFNDLDASPYHHWLYNIRRREGGNKGMGYNMSIRIWKNNADDATMSDHIEPGDSNHLYEFRRGLRGLTRQIRAGFQKFYIIRTYPLQNLETSPPRVFFDSTRKKYRGSAI